MSNQDFLEQDEEVSELVTALQGRNEIPLKFEYLQDGAQNWVQLVSSDEYGIGQTEIELLEENIPNIAALVGEDTVSLVDVGCGSGVKGAEMIEELHDEGLTVNYAALDISKSMLSKAADRIGDVSGINNVEFHRVDFEEGNFAHITNTLRKLQECQNLLLLLGHTLGNPADKSRLLTNLRESMTGDDYILIGVELFETQDADKIVRHYENEKLYGLLFNILGKLGMNRSDGVFDIEFNSDKRQVEMRFRLQDTVELDVKNNKVEFASGEEILLATSYKFTKRGLHDLLETTGFRIRSFLMNHEETYALALCQTKNM